MKTFRQSGKRESERREALVRVLRARRQSQQAKRRGILLLVVLSMLTLFLLIGTAFIVSADHYRKTQKMLNQVTETSNSSIDQGDLLNEVIGQLVRDTRNQNSALRFHSLLGDMYGNDGILGQIENVEWADSNTGGTANPTGGQLLQFRLPAPDATDQFGNSLTTRNSSGDIVPALSTMSYAYNGLLLTFLDGPARGQSARIVWHGPLDKDQSNIDLVPEGRIDARLRIVTPRLADGSVITQADMVRLEGSRVAINGRPFNGTGVGYNSTAGTGAKLSAAELVAGVSRQTALMPNAAFFDPQFLDSSVFTINGTNDYYAHINRWSNLSALEQERLINGLGLVGVGGSDESYDAVDFQNMILGLMTSNPIESAPAAWRTPAPGALSNGNQSVVIPSFHRPALINYWRSPGALPVNINGDEVIEPNLLRKVSLRPSLMDHPNFSGSNPEFANLLSTFNAPSGKTAANRDALLDSMIYGPWDVDNDNDGVRDSVWVDFGAPVRENSDGKLVKPLAAVLVLDMDGRLNLNAHGSEDIANAATNPAFSQPIAGTGNTTNILPQGQGFGPAEISLEPLFPIDTSSSLSAKVQRWKTYKRMFRGVQRGQRIVPDLMDGQDTNAANPTPRIEFLRRSIGKFGQDDGATYLPGDQGFDLEAQMKMQGLPWDRSGLVSSAGPDGTWGNGDDNALGSYASPPDLKGRYALGINDLGQPVYEILDDNAGSSQFDSPYELDLSLGAIRGDNNDADDGAFGVAELERVLRAYDPDAGSLPSRIWDFFGEFKDNSNETVPNLDRLNLTRTSLTTDSYDLPVPNVVVPEWMRNGLPNGSGGVVANTAFATVMNRPAAGASFSDLLEYRLRAVKDPVWRRGDYVNNNNPTTTTPDGLDDDLITTGTTGGITRWQQIQREVRVLLPADLANGLRLDINRPLGNGRDDDGNGVVDEPGENEGSFWASSDARLDNFTGNDGSNFGRFRDAVDRNGDKSINNDYELGEGDVNNDGSTDINDRVFVHNLRRQTLAKDLYVMALALVDPIPELPTTPPPTQDQIDKRREKVAARARKLAQWAINVVDFRDPDGIMTAFEYDVNPFDGWAPDGNLATDADIVGTDNQLNTDDDVGGIVWGAERPELLITETLAWHDRRVENTEQESPVNDEDGDGNVDTSDKGQVGTNPNQVDTDYDQQERPQGIGFVEIYNPWPRNDAANSDIHDLTTDPGVDSGVNLAAVVDDSPVWRLYVPRGGGPAKDPDDFDAANQPTKDMTADRSVYFTGFDPEAVNPIWEEDGVAYFNDLTRNPVPPVRPGSYMVVGSGVETSTGSGVYLAPFGARIGQVDENTRGIRLNTNNAAGVSVEVRDGSGNPVGDTELGAQSVFAPSDLASVAIIDQTRLGQSAGIEVPFSFSEPPGGYLVGNINNPQQYQGGAQPLDIPLDDQRANVAGGGGGLAGALGNDLSNPDGETRISLPREGAGGGAGGAAGTAFAERGRRTVPGFRWVYLQRLANPTLPWNPEQGIAGHDPARAVNPYMTIDSMAVNVTVFNGIDEKEERKDPSGGDPLEFDNDSDASGGGAVDTFASLQRGRFNRLDPTMLVGEAGLADLQEHASRENERNSRPADPENTATLPTQVQANLWGTEILTRQGDNNLGLWRNRAGMNGNGSHPGSNSYNLRAVPDCTLGFLNEPFRADGSTEKQTPEMPFPWVTWNNRPFANAGELMQVPAIRSSQLLQTFSMRTSTAQNEAYDNADNVNEFQLSNTLMIEVDGPFGHLLNFFRTEVDTNGTAGDLTDDKGIAGLHRLLDYVHVPSLYVGTENWLNPMDFGDNTTALASIDDPRYGLQPPFNKVSSYREPGRVNLNTVVSEAVYQGMMHGDTNPTNPPNGVHPGPTWESLVDSRRGYGSANQSMLRLNGDTPTFFENPFRSADASDLVPTASMLMVNTGAGDGQTTVVRTGVQGSILREGATANTPLFSANTADNSNEFRNSNRNPYFRYQPMTRLSSMTTTRSNVYAVWVTIGFFEVTEAPAWPNGLYPDGVTTATVRFNGNRALYDRVYPEGYMLGQEAGSETGDVQRVREFAVVDRTVPVAFEPGKNHNVDKAIRLRRRIE